MAVPRSRESTAKRRENFIRLAENRTQKIIETIGLLGNLSNKRNYEYSESDYSKIIKALRQSLNECEKKYLVESRKSNISDKTSFSLKQT